MFSASILRIGRADPPNFSPSRKEAEEQNSCLEGQLYGAGKAE